MSASDRDNLFTVRRACRAARLTIAYALLLTPCIAVAGPKLGWEAAFPMHAAAERDVYFSARYLDPESGWHQLKTWRHGRQFLQRQTDASLDLFVEARAQGPAPYNYELFDHQRHRVTRLNHANLYRIGVFLSWAGLAHVLERPKRAFEVTRSAALAAEDAADCSWFVLVRDLSQPEQRSRVCWSKRWGLPQRIRERTAAGTWDDQFVLEEVREIPSDVHHVWGFPRPPQDYAVFDAAGDFEPSQD